MGSASRGRDMNIRARSTPHARHCRIVSPNWKADSGVWLLLLAWRQQILFCECLGQGDHVVAGNDVYGGTFRLFDKVLRRFGLDFTFADTTDPENLAEALTPSTRIVWLETPTNPLLAV
jgi:cystathionine beta-lyase/cystathionine gamma-synthase